MTEPDETLEDIAAKALNGVMIVGLSSSFPAFLAWSAIYQRGRGALDIDTQAAAGVTLLIYCLFGLRLGLRLLRESATAWRGRSR